jgi:hypothetical protein
MVHGTDGAAGATGIRRKVTLVLLESDGAMENGRCNEGQGNMMFGLAGTDGANGIDGLTGIQINRQLLLEPCKWN